MELMVKLIVPVGTLSCSSKKVLILKLTSSLIKRTSTLKEMHLNQNISKKNQMILKIK